MFLSAIFSVAVALTAWSDQLVRLRVTYQADNVTAASCAAADVNTAIGLAVDGDIVGIPSCPSGENWACSGAGHVSWTNKNIWLRGAGIDQTVINCSGGVRAITYTITNAAKGASQISGITWRGTQTGTVIRVDSTGLNAIPTGRWRMHDMKFDFNPPIGSGYQVMGVNYGVIDHNIIGNGWQGVAHWVRIDGALTSEFGGFPATIQGDFMWSQPLDLGTRNFVFLEDNTFPTVVTSAIGVSFVDSGIGGARMVFRYNTTLGGFVFSHWAQDDQYNAGIYEVYRNVFNAGTGSAWKSYAGRLQGGTGVWYENTHAGAWTNNYIVLDEPRGEGYSPQETASPLLSCNGTRTWDGSADPVAAPGWPCFSQIGRTTGKTFAQIAAGDQPGSVPFYLWSNGSEATCATGGACTDIITVSAETPAYIKATAHPNGDVDYVLNGTTAKPGYTPYTYPHPCVTAVWPTAC